MQFPRRNNGDMSSSNTATIPPTAESAEAVAKAQALAAENQLEFRERHALTIDAQAHTLLDPKYAREMRAIPLGVENGRPVVAVADPSERRLSAIRKLVGGETKFVLVAPESLDALLKSRIFSENHDAHAPHPENGNGNGLRAEAPAAQESPAEEEAPAETVEPQPEAPASLPQLPDIDAASVTQLAEQLAAAAQTLLALQAQVQGIAAQFEQTRQQLREQKEQLALAASKADQDRARIRSVAASLADDVAKLEQTKADLAERLSGLVQDE